MSDPIIKKLPVELRRLFTYSAGLIEATRNAAVLQDAAMFFEAALKAANEENKIGVERKNKSLIVFDLMRARDINALLLAGGEDGAYALEEKLPKSFFLTIPEKTLSRVKRIQDTLGLETEEKTISIIMQVYTDAINEARKGSRFVYVNENGGLSSFQTIGMFTALASPL